MKSILSNTPDKYNFYGYPKIRTAERILKIWLFLKNLLSLICGHKISEILFKKLLESLAGGYSIKNHKTQ
jgi:hypothetical protein